jgi:uncharacterized membrane protein YkvA (DUF1232 family)
MLEAAMDDVPDARNPGDEDDAPEKLPRKAGSGGHIFADLSSKVANLARRIADRLGVELAVLYYAMRHPRTGLAARIVMSIALAYAMSPIDLIPDFIPILGQLDDLLIVPALVALALRLIPADVVRECRARAVAEPPSLRKNPVAAVVIIILWILVLVWLGSKIVAGFAHRAAG